MSKTNPTRSERREIKRVQKMEEPSFKQNFKEVMRFYLLLVLIPLIAPALVSFGIYLINLMFSNKILYITIEQLCYIYLVSFLLWAVFLLLTLPLED